MAIAARSGPRVVFGQAAPGAGTGAAIEYNPQRGPSVFDQYLSLADPRTGLAYMPGQAANAIVAGWFAGGSFCTIDQAPSTLAVNNIAASQSPGAGAIALVSSTAAGVTVGSTVTRLDTGLVQTGLLALDGAMTRLGFGSDAAIQIWDPTKAISRAVSITSGGNDTGITFTVNGFDVYGQPMSETMTGASGAAVSGKKAFKYILSVTHTGSIATTVTVGTLDIFGLALRNDVWGDADIVWNNAFITANAGFVAAVTTDPATAITGDVRGTYAVQSAADGTKRLRLWQSVMPANVSTVKGLLGVTQFAGAF